MKKLLLVLSAFIWTNKTLAQPSSSTTSNTIYEDMKGLNTFARVLFITMRPGDEDAQLMAYLSKHEHCDVCLLMLTRGEKMKNYAGYETMVDAGIIHAQEMAKASEMTGCETMATCAMDLGNYDSSVQVFKIWDKEKVLSNIAWAIRSYRPDIIIVPDKNYQDSTTEILLQSVKEANEQAGNKDYFPVQLAGRFSWLAAHSAKEIFAELPDSSKENKDSCVAVYSNLFDNASGLTYKEIAGKSYLCERSIFKYLDEIPLRKDTQYLKPLLNASKTLFQDIDTSSLRTGFAMQDEVNNIFQHYDFLHPENSLSLLTDLYKQIESSGMDNFWKKIKLHRLQNIILNCAGISIKSFTDKPFGVKGRNFTASVNIINHLSDMHIASIQIGDSLVNPDIALNKKSDYTFKKDIYISFDKQAYQPFWLNNPIDFVHADYYVDDSMTDKLVDTACYSAIVHLTINNLPLTIKVPVVYQHFDRMEGEITEPFYIVEPVLVSQSPVVLLTNITGDTKANKNPGVTLKFRTLFDSAMYTILQIQEPGKFAKDKSGKPGSSPRFLYKSDSVFSFRYNDAFKINIPFPKEDDAALLTPTVLMRFPEGGQAFDADIKKVEYPYIPSVIYNYHDQTNVVNDEIKTRGKRIAYLFGLSEDPTEQALHQLGYKTDYLNLEDVLQHADSLKNYDAVVIGNYLPLDKELDTTEINLAENELDGYVYHGGLVISLSNNALNKLMPLHLQANARQISNASIAHIVAGNDSSLLNYPNKINLSKIASWQGPVFSGFAIGYDNKYQPVLKVQADNNVIYPVLSASLGGGQIIYCNLDLPLQTMNAQPDAFKLLANLIAAKYKDKNAH